MKMKRMARIVALPDLSPYDLRALRLVINHGASLSAAQGAEIEARLGCRIAQAYGSVDCGGISATHWDDPQQVRLVCRVNGEVMQDGNTRDMIFDIPTTIESLSSGMTLEPGDIISTGTPSGVGFARTPPVFLKPGDKVEGEVEGVGTLQVEIAEP